MIVAALMRPKHAGIDSLKGGGLISGDENKDQHLTVKSIWLIMHNMWAMIFKLFVILYNEQLVVENKVTSNLPQKR